MDYNQQDLEFMWNVLIKEKHTKVCALDNNGIKISDLNEIMKKQIPTEFFKKCHIEDLTVFLINKGFKMSQINQIVKAKQDNVKVFINNHVTPATSVVGWIVIKNIKTRLYLS